MSGVLVTAATTPVGCALVTRLLEDGHQVLAVGIEDDPYEHLPLETPGLHYQRCDLTRGREMRRLLFGVARELSVSSVLHTALHRSADDAGRGVHRLNVETTRDLLRLSERHPTIKRFVYQSYAEVYRHDHLHPNLIAEDQPLELGSGAPQRVRNRVEADLTVCTRMGMSPLHILVLRFAEVLAPNSGSQLWDWLSSRVCMRPLGYNPIVNLITVDDVVEALTLALATDAQGVFNIPGRDTLPVKRLIQLWGARDVPLPGPMLSPLYRLRRKVKGTEFRYSMNRARFHTSDLLDGARARAKLAYQPQHAIHWPTRG